MAFRNLVSCYICDRRFPPRNLMRIDGEENAHKREISIRRRDENNMPPLDVSPNTRICLNCSVSILNEIQIIEHDPSCLRVNVLSQSRSSSCIICNGVGNLHRLSSDCKAYVFVKKNIYIPEGVKSCEHHLDDRGYILYHLLDGLRFVNRPYVIKGQLLQSFLESLRTIANNATRITDENDFSDEEFKIFFSVTKQQFQELATYCDPVPCQGGFRYVYKKDLLLFLCKLRQGLSDDFLSVLFQYPTRQVTSLAVATTRQSLMQRFVPTNIGFESITREQYIERHVSEYPNILYNPEPDIPRAIVKVDGTYSYIPKSSNFRALRQSFSLHKGRHLVKPALIVAPDGYILEIQGPYFSDTRNNDAAMLRNEFENDMEHMHEWFQEGDIFILDRGYRDITEFLDNQGVSWKMPAFLERNQKQLTTEQANDSRLVTKMRWVVEARNGHIKSIFKFLDKTIQIQHVPNLRDFYKIAGAIINRYHPLLIMEGADANKAYQLLARAQEPNVVQALVETENLHTRNAQRWVKLDANQLNDFPALEIDLLKDITTGIYQLKLAPSYIQDKLQRDEDEEFQVEMLRDEDRLPTPGFMRVRVYSRFRNSTKYQLWVSYQSINDDEADEDFNPINGYYCTCKSGARTLGTCAHIASVLWFFGYARHQVDIHYPSTELIETVKDAAHRLPQENPN